LVEEEVHADVEVVVIQVVEGGRREVGGVGLGGVGLTGGWSVEVAVGWIGLVVGRVGLAVDWVELAVDGIGLAVNWVGLAGVGVARPVSGSTGACLFAFGLCFYFF
jgi:hypothetical protein